MLVVHANAVVPRPWIVSENMELVVNSIEALARQRFGAVFPSHVHARHELRVVTTTLERQRQRGRQLRQAVFGSEEAREWRCHGQVLDRGYRAILHRLETPEQQIGIEMLTQAHVHVAVWPIQFEQVVAPTLAINYHDIWLERHRFPWRSDEQRAPQRRHRVPTLHTHRSLCVNFEGLAERDKTILGQDIARAPELERVSFLLESLFQHIGSVRHDVVNRLVVRHESVLYLQREAPHRATHTDGQG